MAGNGWIIEVVGGGWILVKKLRPVGGGGNVILEDGGWNSLQELEEESLVLLSSSNWDLLWLILMAGNGWIFESGVVGIDELLSWLPLKEGSKPVVDEVLFRLLEIGMSLPLPFFLEVVEGDALLMRCLQDRLSSATMRMRGLCLSSFEEIDPEGVVRGEYRWYFWIPR